ncbi:hypothetical protein ACS0TY_003128 [Phlomoides rotata]
MSYSGTTSRLVTCHCKKEAIVVTSWKNGNVGRRFMGNDGYCKFLNGLTHPCVIELRKSYRDC